ncbi:MAG: ABC transporter substrate-binding protein [Bacteroidales bacterium]|nr:ABC transporter substrate-binding protein [Bacteroidales bacterium]
MNDKTKILILSLLLITLASCFNNKSKGNIEITDMLGRKVFVPEKIEKIICLRASALRLVSYIDGVERIVGVEEIEINTKRPYSFAFPQLKKKPSVGPAMGGDLELITIQNPDLIFITCSSVEDANKLSEKTGIPVVAIEYGDLQNEKTTFYKALQLIGKILNKGKRAEEIINFVENNISELKNLTKDCSPKTAYIGGVAYSGSHGIVSTEPFYPPFAFVNAKNVAGNLSSEIINPVKGTMIDKEILYQWNPEYIFLDLSGLDLCKTDLKENGSLEKLDAIKEENIYSVYPYNSYSINYELVLINSWIIGKVLYPEKFKEINIEEKAKEILTLFLGKDIFPEIKKLHGNYGQIDVDK